MGTERKAGENRRRKRNTILGLDLGRHAVKAVELERDGDNLSVVGCAYEAVASGTDYTDAVHAILKAGRFGANRIVAGFSGRGSVLATINLPKNGDADLEQAVRDEAARLVPYDLDKAQLDYQILDSEHLPHIRALLVAARRSDVLDRLELFFAAGLHPMRIEPEAVALANAFETANRGDYFLPEGAAAALVDFGAGKTLITVTDGTHHVFRDFPLGGDGLTEMIANRLGWSLEKAEAAKRNPEKHLDVIKDAIYPGIEDLTAEIRSCIERFRIASDGRGVDLLLLSGGLVAFPGIPALAGRMTGVETRVFDNFGGVDAEGLDAAFLDRHGHELILAFGLACHARE